MVTYIIARLGTVSVTIKKMSVHSCRSSRLWCRISCDDLELIFPPFYQIRGITLMFRLILPLSVILTACDSRRMRHSNSAQQTVFWSVQLPVCPIWSWICRAGYWCRGPPPPDHLFPLRPVQGSHCGCAPALWSQSPGKASDGGGGMQVWDEPWGKECRGCSFTTPVTV